MSLTASNKHESNIEPVPSGLHTAVCYGVVDLGSQEDQQFGGVKHKVALLFEIPECRIDLERDGKKVNLPRAISQRYTLHIGDKANLRRDLESWRGRKFTADELAAFDLKNVLGAPCQIVVVHKAGKEGKVYANIQTIVPLGKGEAKPKLENEKLWFSFDELTPSDNLPEIMPKWIVKIVKESKEWAKHENPDAQPASDEAPPDTTPPPDVDDGLGIPF